MLVMVIETGGVELRWWVDVTDWVGIALVALLSLEVENCIGVSV